jgi:hypothetical protein
MPRKVKSGTAKTTKRGIKKTVKKMQANARNKKPELVEYAPTGRRKAVDPREDRPLGEIRPRGSKPKPKPEDKMKGTNKKKTSSRIKKATPWRETKNARKYQKT